MGVLFTFPSRYYFAIGHPGVFSLARWSLLIHTGFHVPHATRVVSCLPMDSAAVRKVDLFGNLRIYAYFQLPEAFRRLLRPSSSLGA
ncbi:hypothetical protein MUK42_12901 [Musa troglodytarum]|uniref:Uncharacterized protein n=3 Tax=Mesangiospermae TaxID=1437183 RepID=A0A9E7KLK4_9LILI|nr:hypothetical protein MUK42_12901 [Musa troglodytarum]